MEMDNISENETIINTNDISTYLFGLQHEFEIKYKNDFLKEEVDFLISHRYIDKKSLFNYIFIYNYYSSLMYQKIVYQINIIINEVNLKSILKNIIEFDLDLTYVEEKIIFEINSINLIDKTENFKFDLYHFNEESGNKNKILGNANKKEVENELKQNNKNIIYYIKIIYEDEIKNVPFFQFHIYKIKSINIEKNKEKYNNLLEKANDNFKSNISKTSEKFFNKKEMEKDSYFTKYIYNRKTILQKIINILITSEFNDNQKQIFSSFNPQIINKINEITKDIILKNYSILEKTQNQNLTKTTTKKDFFDIINSDTNINQLIYRKISKHLKSEIKFFKNTLIHYNTLINDSISLSTESTFIISEPGMITFHTGSIENLINSEIEEYKDKTFQLYDKFKSNKTKLIDEEEEKILQKISNKYFITNNDFKDLIDSYTQILLNLKQSSEDFFQNLKLENQNLFSNLNKTLQETGIHSTNFQSYISNLHTKTINVENNIQNLIDSKTSEYNKLAVQLGISGTLGLATSGLVFTASRAATAIGSDAIAGSLGGPVGTVAGIFIGTFTFLGQSYYSFRKSKDDILKLEIDLRNATNVCFEVFKDNAKVGYEENKFVVEKDLVEVRKFIDILLRRAIMSKSCY